MMAAIRRHLPAVLLTAAAAVCFCIAVVTGSFGSQGYTQMFLLAPYSPAEAGTLLEEDGKAEIPIGAVFWSKTGEQTVTNPELSRSTQLTALGLVGNSNGLFPDNITLFQDDAYGCLIDEGAAYALYGSLDVVGLTLAYGERELIVRGVLPGDEKLFLYQHTKSSDAVLTRLVVLTEDPQTADLFVSRNGLSTQTVPLYFYRLGIQAGGWLLIIAVYLWFFWKSMRLKRKYSAVLLSHFIYWGIFLLISFLYLRILPWPDTLPLRLVPSKWSDFGFWSEQMKTLKEEWNVLFAMEKTFVETRLFQKMSFAAIIGSAALIFWIILSAAVKIKSGKALLTYVFVSIFSTFVVCLVNRSTVGIYTWWIIPLYLLASYYFSWQQQRPDKSARKAPDTIG